MFVSRVQQYERIVRDQDLNIQNYNIYC